MYMTPRDFLESITQDEPRGTTTTGGGGGVHPSASTTTGGRGTSLGL